MEPLRYELEETGDYIEFSPVWGRGEIRAFWANATPRDDWLALVRSKIVSLHIGELVGADQVTDAGLDTLEWGVFVWFQNACIAAVADVQQLGEAFGRRLWAMRAEAKATPDRPTH